MQDSQEAEGERYNTQNAFSRAVEILKQMDIKFLQDAIIARDRKSDGVNRDEVISTIADMTESSIKEAERAYNYCIEKGYLKRLRGQGRVRKAQSTISKRLQVTTASQRRWHN